MSFSLIAFLEDIAVIGPTLVSGILNLKNETGSVSRTQLASDSLHLATGITTALTSTDPVEQVEAQAASVIANTVVQTIAKSSGQSVN